MATVLEPAFPAQSEDPVADSASIQRALRELIDPERILIRPIDRIAFASDASFYRLIPQAVIQPTTTEEIKHLFRFSHNQRIPLVFRAGGTSLSGQSITDGILVDIGRYWRNVRVEQNGKTIRVQPGLIGQQANNALRLYSRKIGPDPASIASCRLGGILSNNSSGMCCGVVQNAYHTLASLTFILPSGTQIDTADPDADKTLRTRWSRSLCETLLRLKAEIEADADAGRAHPLQVQNEEHHRLFAECLSRLQSPDRHLQPSHHRLRGHAGLHRRSSAQYCSLITR